MYDAVTWDLRVQQENYACTDAVLDMSRQLKGNWPRGAEKIYVPEYVDRGHQEIWYQMQFIPFPMYLQLWLLILVCFFRNSRKTTIIHTDMKDSSA